MTHKVVYEYRVMSQSGKVYLRRIGTAAVNHDGSISVKLECLPTCQDMLIMDYVERQEETR